MAAKSAFESASERQWMAQWRKAAAALEEQRAKELREMTEEQASAAAEALLDLARSTPPSPSRVTHSGLVELQSYLKKLRSQ